MTTWPVRHPGIGVLHYATEAEAVIAAGTAGTVLPAVPRCTATNYGQICSLNAGHTGDHWQSGVRWPAAAATAPVVLTWDWREQPDLDELAEALRNLGGVHLHQVDTGSDEFAIVLATQRLDQDAVQEIYRRR